MQWTGCHGEERHGGDRRCGGAHSGQGTVADEDLSSQSENTQLKENDDGIDQPLDH